MRTRTRSRTRIRTALVATAGIASALSLVAITPALAGATGPAGTVAAPWRGVSAPAAPAQGDPRDVTGRVANFYGSYIDSVYDLEDPTASANAKALKKFYLSTAAQKKVAAFEAKEHADGILFAQNVPVKWKVTYTGSGAGHATSLVTLTWSDGANPGISEIKVQSDLKTRRITALTPSD
ncbi:hypothetical protein P3L51_04075 [Streptomyces sp. PSRA5]|uniref:hypothetical protein n=1 Tax=Streptomyces panacea TaxID=3035064 RepID=UPI00339C6310